MSDFDSQRVRRRAHVAAAIACAVQAAIVVERSWALVPRGRSPEDELFVISLGAALVIVLAAWMVLADWGRSLRGVVAAAFAGGAIAAAAAWWWRAQLNFPAFAPGSEFAPRATLAAGIACGLIVCLGGRLRWREAAFDEEVAPAPEGLRFGVFDLIAVTALAAAALAVGRRFRDDEPGIALAFGVHLAFVGALTFWGLLASRRLVVRAIVALAACAAPVVLASRTTRGMPIGEFGFYSTIVVAAAIAWLLVLRVACRFGRGGGPRADAAAPRGDGAA